jgi:hypothetical protein
MPSGRTLLIVGVCLLVLGPLLWKYVIGPPIARRQSWEGTLIEKYTKTHGGRFKWYSYHWRVECDDGRIRNPDVDHLLWVSADVGSRLRKTKGERYPRVVGPPDGVRLLREKMGDKFPEDLRHLVPVEE